MRLKRLLLIAPLAMIGTIAMALDLDSLWDFGNAALSEERFEQALATAQGDDALILQTQVARTLGLRGDFARARAILSAIEPKLAGSGAEVRVRHALEWGRTFASAAHPEGSTTSDSRAQARSAYLQAFELAKTERLDALAIDALHMLAFVDTLPVDQLKWGREALALSTHSSQPSAQKWEASLRNNIGMALHDLGRYDEALAEFQQAVSLRERGNDAEATRVAHWMVAWILRALKRPVEALAIQLRLEKECAAAGAPDPFVFEELETLYREGGDAARAEHYAALKNALPR
jgi:tetratricopeptide (TPR) repeat protein